MSQQVEITATCPKCGHQYQGKLFRTLWGENEGFRKAVMNDNINICTCPKCGHSFHAPMSMLYVDGVKQFAVWWEPQYDSSINEFTEGFTKMLGHGNYYENAPRISDWEEFKDTINKYYRGELQGQSEESTRQQKQALEGIAANLSKSLESNKSNKSGCLGICLGLTIIVSFSIALLVC